MAFLHSKSEAIKKPETALFEIPGTQTDIDKSYWDTYQPSNSLDDNSQIEYHVSGQGNVCLDLLHTMWYVKCQILKKDGKLLVDKEDVGITNNFQHSLIADCIVKLNGHLTTPLANNYSQKANFENTHGFGPAAKQSHLQSQMYYKDTAGFMNDRTDKNKGYVTRKEFIALSKPFEMFGPLYCDIFTINRYMLNEVNMDVKIVLNDPAYCLMAAANDYKIKILEAVLYVRKVELGATLMLNIHETLKDKTAKYPYVRTEMKTFKISRELQMKVADNIYNGVQPKRVVIGFLRDTALAGTITENPYNYENFGISKLVLYSAGQQFPQNVLQPDFTNVGGSVVSYSSLYSGSGIHYGDEGNDISRLDYAKGYTFWSFDFTPDLSAASGSHWNPIRLGNLRIDISLTPGLTTNITGLVYAEFDALMQVDLKRNITLSS